MAYRPAFFVLVLLALALSACEEGAPPPPPERVERDVPKTGETVEMFKTGNTEKAARVGFQLQQGKYIEAAFVKEVARDKMIRVMVRCQEKVFKSLGKYRDGTVRTYGEIVAKAYPDQAVVVAVIDENLKELAYLTRPIPSEEVPIPPWTIDLID